MFCLVDGQHLDFPGDVGGFQFVGSEGVAPVLSMEGLPVLDEGPA